MALTKSDWQRGKTENGRRRNDEKQPLTTYTQPHRNSDIALAAGAHVALATAQHYSESGLKWTGWNSQPRSSPSSGTKDNQRIRKLPAVARGSRPVELTCKHTRREKNL